MKTINIYKGIIKLPEDNLPLKDKYFFNRLRNQLTEIDELLLLKLDDKTYKDLSSSKRYSIDEIEPESLVPFNRMVSCDKNISKRKAIFLYNQKLQEKLPIKNLYIGNIGVIWYSEKEEQNSEIKIALRCSYTKKNALLLKSGESFKDLESFISYPESNINIGQSRVVASQPFIRSISTDNDIEEEMELSKVLSKYRRKIK